MSTDATDLCDVWELARRNGVRRGELPLGRATRLAQALFDATGTLHYCVSGHIDTQGRPAATLELDGRVCARCDRCGGPIEVPIRERAEFFFVVDEGELARLPIDEAPEEPLLGSRRFDLEALVEDQAILALPISPRHDDCVLPVSTDELPAADDEGTHRPFGSLAALKRRKE